MNINDYLKTAKRVIADANLKENAIITFRQIIDDANITIAYDDVGNPIIPDLETETITIKCWLKQGKPPERDVQVGNNLESEYFIGELIEPKIFPFPLRPNGEITVTINGRSGVFFPSYLFDSPASEQWEIKEYHGQKIAGYVQFREGN